MMKFTDYSYINKETVYNVYCLLFNTEPKYNTVTRAKMLNEIAKFYSNSDNILKNCTLKEIEYLYNIINGNEQTHSICMEIYLNNKLLLDYQNGVNVPIDIHSSIIEAYKRINDKQLFKRDEEVSILLGMLRIHAIMPANNFLLYGKLLLNKEENEIVELMGLDIAKWHIAYNEKNDKGIDEFVFIDGFVDYDEIKESIEIYHVLVPKLLSPEEYQQYFYYGIDLSKDYNRRFMNGYRANFNCVFDYSLLLADAVLGIDIDNIGKKYVLNQFLSNLNIDFNVYKEVVYNYPSAAINGYSFNEYDKKVDKEKTLRKKHLEKYEPQKNACIGDIEADIFYKLFFNLLSYINNEYDIDETLVYPLQNRTGVDPQKLIHILDKFYENPKKYVGEFLELEGDSYNKKERKIIDDFKTARKEIGVLVNYKRGYCEFLCSDGLYAIKGIRANIDEIIAYDRLPCVINVGLMMYKGNIIFDGVISEASINIGGGMFENLINEAEKMKLSYSLKERKQEIITMFGEEDNVDELIISKRKTDLLSSLKEINKEYAKKYMKDNFIDSYKEWKEEVLSSFERNFEFSKNSQSTIDFFKRLVMNENSDNIVFPSDDVRSNIVFLYKDANKIKYYIPDEIKEIIWKELSKHNKEFN